MSIDYKRMHETWPKQQAALAKALSEDKDERVAAVRKVALEASLEWDEIGAWPDDWAMFNRALDDVQHWSDPTDLDSLRAEHFAMVETLS